MAYGVLWLQCFPIAICEAHLWEKISQDTPDERAVNHCELWQIDLKLQEIHEIAKTNCLFQQKCAVGYFVPAASEHIKCAVISGSRQVHTMF